MMTEAIFENKSSDIGCNIQKTLMPTPHLHKELEIIYVVKGKCIAFVENKPNEICQGDIFISFPNQIHYYEKSVAGEYKVIIFSPNVIFKHKQFLYDNTPRKNVIHTEKYPEIKELIEKLYNYDGDFELILQAGILNEIIATLLPELELKESLNIDNSSIRSIINYCSVNYASPLTLEEVAQQVHLNKYYISHLINKKMGISFNGYINSLRIKEACDLLEGTDKHTSEISEEIGFGSIRSFNRAFLKIMNETPGEYKKKIKKSEKIKNNTIIKK